MPEAKMEKREKHNTPLHILKEELTPQKCFLLFLIIYYIMLKLFENDEKKSSLFVVSHLFEPVSY